MIAPAIEEISEHCRSSPNIAKLVGPLGLEPRTKGFT
jgi:hypothetical protein